MDLDEAQRTRLDEWAAGWNAHDLDRITKHYSDDVVFSSPVAARILDGSDGVVRGIAALRAYWREGLRRNPDLRFEVVGVRRRRQHRHQLPGITPGNRPLRC